MHGATAIRNIVAVFLFAFTVSVAAQHHHGSQSYASATDFVNLPAPPVMKGIGTASIKIATGSAAAQQYFDQGLNLLHAFWEEGGVSRVSGGFEKRPKRRDGVLGHL